MIRERIVYVYDCLLFKSNQRRQFYNFCHWFIANLRVAWTRVCREYFGNTFLYRVSSTREHFLILEYRHYENAFWTSSTITRTLFNMEQHHYENIFLYGVAPLQDRFLKEYLHYDNALLRSSTITRTLANMEQLHYENIFLRSGSIRRTPS